MPVGISCIASSNFLFIICTRSCSFFFLVGGSRRQVWTNFRYRMFYFIFYFIFTFCLKICSKITLYTGNDCFWQTTSRKKYNFLLKGEKIFFTKWSLEKVNGSITLKKYVKIMKNEGTRLIKFVNNWAG